MYSISIYVFSAIFVALLHIAGVYVLIRSLVSKKVYFLLFVTFAFLMFFMTYLNFSPILLIVLFSCSGILVKASRKVYTVFVLPVLYILNCLMSYMVTIPIIKYTGKSIDELNGNYLYLFATSVASFVISLPILFLLRYLIREKLLTFFERINGRILLITTFHLTICATLIFLISSLLDNKNIPFDDYMLLIAFIIIYAMLTVGMIVILLRNVRKTFENEKKIEYLENLNQYTSNLEAMYNNLRSFKHDYVNIMASMTAFMEENRYDDLKTYFNDHILPMEKNLTQNNDTLNKLQRIKILELKSILYTKVLFAVNHNIEVMIDITDDILSVNIDTVDLTRILGIYMDNAIEACLETEHPAVSLHMGIVDNDVMIIISNTYIDTGLSVSQIQKKDVTTKGAGHGIGLYNVSKILNNYDNIFHETLMENGLFSQQLRIS